MDAQEQLFTLLTAIEAQQKILDQALSGLEAERTALAQERQAIQRTIETAVHHNLKDLGTTAAQAMEVTHQAATREGVERLKNAYDVMANTHARLQDLSDTLNWRWILLVFTLILSLVTSFWFVTGWYRHDITRLVEERDQLERDIRKGRDIALEWEKRASKAKLTQCGSPPHTRLCVRVNTEAGRWGGNGEDYYVLYGY